MTEECISPLRQRMIEDMSLRHFGEKTQKDYIRAVKNLTMFLGRSPDTATAEDLRRFQLHLTGSRVRPPTINFTVTTFYCTNQITVDVVVMVFMTCGAVYLRQSDAVALDPVDGTDRRAVSPHNLHALKNVWHNVLMCCYGETTGEQSCSIAGQGAV